MGRMLFWCTDWFFLAQRAFAKRIMGKVLYIITTVTQTTAVEPNERKKNWVDMSWAPSHPKENKMEPKDEQQPLVRVKTESGIVYYPRFEKNTEGKWTPTDPSFQEMNRRRFDSEKPVKKDGY